MILQERLTTWQNLRLAYQNASRGKRGHTPAAEFEMLLADNLLDIQKELEEKIYQPGNYHSFHIHEPKRRLISAAPFRDRVVHHALCFTPSACRHLPLAAKRLGYASRSPKYERKSRNNYSKFPFRIWGRTCHNSAGKRIEGVNGVPSFNALCK